MGTRTAAWLNRRLLFYSVKPLEVIAAAGHDTLRIDCVNGEMGLFTLEWVTAHPSRPSAAYCWETLTVGARGRA